MDSFLHALKQLLEIIEAHEALILTVAPLILSLIQTTRWGRHNKKALTATAEAIEALGDAELKKDVATRISQHKPGVKYAMEDVVKTVDVKKVPDSTLVRVVKILCALRGAKKQ